MSIAIGDLTRANPGTESFLLQRLARRYKPTDNLVVVGRSDQQLQMDGRQVEIRRVEPAHYTQVVAAVRALLDAFLRDPAATVDVVSFHAAVFGLKASLAPGDQERVKFMAWSHLGDGTGTTTPTREGLGARPATKIVYSWPSHLISISEAIQILESGLTNAGAIEKEKAVRKSDIRQLLAFSDDRFKKSEPLGSTPGLVTLILEGAQRAGRVEIDLSSGDSVNPPVWLAHGGRNAKGAEPAPTTKRLSASRSQHFIDALKAQELGPYSRLRWQLYRGLADTIRDATARQLTLHLRAAVNGAVSNTRILVKGSVPDEFNWRKLSRFLFRLLELENVIVDKNGQPIVPSIATLSTPVGELVPDFELLLDGALVLALVRTFDDIQLHDIQPLAGALYLQRDNDAQDRIVRILEMLLGAKPPKVHETPTKCLAVSS